MKTRNKILMSLGGTVAALLALEIGLALFFPQDTMSRILAQNAPIWVPDEVLPGRLQPGATGRLTTAEFDTSILINSHGFRGEEFELDKGDALRVIAAGDSFTYGYGIEADETYSARLQARLDGAELGRVQVINCGFAAGYNPSTYYLWLKERGLALDPDLVIIGFFVGNDLDHDLISELKWKKVDEEGLPTRIVNRYAEIERGYQMRKQKQWNYRFPVLRDSHLVQAVAKVLPSGSAPVDETGKARDKPQRTALFNRWIYRAQYEDRTVEVVERVKKLFRAMARITRERDIPLLVVMIPTREQIRPQDFEFEKFPEMEGHDLDKPQGLFSEFFAQEGIAHLDLLPLLRAEKRRMFFPVNLHWNKDANDIAAAAIAKKIAEDGLLSR